MSILTGRELEFLVSLRTNWNRLYWNELVRLLREDDGWSDAKPPASPRAAEQQKALRARRRVPRQISTCVPSSITRLDGIW